jgi:hypothetical protein
MTMNGKPNRKEMRKIKMPTFEDAIAQALRISSTRYETRSGAEKLNFQNKVKLLQQQHFFL